MTKKINLSIGFEFYLENSNIYKITKILDDSKFLAIWIGTSKKRDLSTYHAFINNGDFRLDNALFEIDDNERIIKIHDATGIIGLADASKEYKLAIYS